MSAARLANLEHGRGKNQKDRKNEKPGSNVGKGYIYPSGLSISELSKMLGVSEALIKRAKRILRECDEK